MLHRTALALGAADAATGWARRGVVLTAVSSVVASQAARWLPGADVGVLPNGIDVGFWRNEGHTTATPDSELVFVTAMRLSRKKRADRLLRAFAGTMRFVGGSPSLSLVIAGDGPDRPALQRLASELGVADRVRFAGALSRVELRALYARSAVFVLPSERESFGLAALEARAAGLPVIAMLAGGARDFIQPGVNGLLARDAAELATFMRRMALDAPFRAFVRARNLATPPSYDWPDVTALHAALYEVAVRRAGTTSPIQR